MSHTRGSHTPTAHWIFLGVIFLYALTIRIVLAPLPFSRNPEGVGSFYGQLARNYLRLPLSRTHGVPVQSIDTPADVTPTFYAHHPPLIPMLIAGTYLVLGDGEWQTRLPTILSTLACVLVIDWMLRRRGRPRAGLIASAFFASIPMTLFYGGHPDCINSTLILFILLTVEAYLRFHASPSVRGIVLLCLAFLPAAWTDWPAYFIVPVLCAHFALTRSPRKWGWMVPFGLWSIVLFAIVYGHIATTIHDWRWMGHQIERRTASTTSDRGGPDFTWASWFVGVAQHNVREHTIPLLLLALGWLTIFSWRRSDEPQPARTIVRILFAYAVLHILVGRQAVLVHPWWWWPLTPALVMASGLFLDEIARWFVHRQMTQQDVSEQGVRSNTVHVSGTTLDYRQSKSWEPIDVIRRQRIINIAMFAGLVLFAVVCASMTLPEFYRPKDTIGGMDASTVEIGQAIQQAAPNGGAVLLAYNDAYDLPLWYYGDRPLKLGVWDLWTFDQRLDDGLCDVAFFRYELKFAWDPDYRKMAEQVGQPWHDRPVGYVYSKQFIEAAPPGFLETLKTRYRFHESEKFLIFDLR